MNSEILVVGNICKDIIYTAASYPLEDSKVKALSKDIRIGGNAGNVTTILSHFPNCNVECCVKLGSCDYSKFVVSEFEKNGIVPSPVIQPNVSIPESVLIHADDTSSRTCFHYRGNCDDLTCDEVISTITDINKYDWVHLEHRRNGLEVLRLAKFIKSCHPDVTLSIDIEKIREGFEEILAVVDYPIVSKEVCKELGYTDVLCALTNLSKKARHALVVTWADKGAGIWYVGGGTGTGGGTGGTEQLKYNHAKQHKVNDYITLCDAFEVNNIIDTIGAGDTFTATFIYCVLRLGIQYLPDCLLHACRLASLKLQVNGMNVDNSFITF